MDATTNQILYATTYQRRRNACCMNGGGPGSGIWKSTDGGETWTRLTKGLPEGPLGRIGIDVYRRRPTILYAVVEGPVRAATRSGQAAGGGEVAPSLPGGPRISQGVNDAPTGLYRSDDAGATWRKVNNANPRPMYFSQIRIDPNDPDVVIYGGVDLQMSTDGGKSVNTASASRIHSDHHAIWIDPANSQHVLIGNDGGLAVSYDQAKTWSFLPNLPVGLFYHVSYDMATPYHVCGGMQDNYVWCGPSAVRGAAGIANYQWTAMQGGDGFVALQDPSDYRIAFSESQDGNMVRIDRVTNETMSIRPLPGPGEPPFRWNWDTPLIQSPHDAKILYAAANRVFRSTDRGLSWTAMTPDLTSNANREEIATMGVKGSDVTIARNDGIQAWPTIVSLAESPRRAGLIYAGTDDGNLQVTRDGGKSWTNVIDRMPGAPKGGWISEVVPSRFDEGTVYATLDNHRLNDFESYIYVSKDAGQSWQPAAGNLKGEVVKTLTEDVKNPDVLYIGTETGLFVSLDRARTWTRIKANLPTVRVDEITIHPRDNAMILATHGRAIWILDHLEPIQEYAAVQSITTGAKLFSPAPSTMYRRPARDRNYEFWGDQTFFGENAPQAAVISWFNSKQTGEVALKITDAAGHEVREISGAALAKSHMRGIQSACWDLRVQPAPAPPVDRSGDSARAQEGASGEGQASRAQEPRAPEPAQSPFGTGCAAAGGGGVGGFGGPAVTPNGPVALGGVYTVALVIDGRTVDSRPLRVTDDPEVVLTSAERRKLFDMAMEIHALQPRVVEAAAAHATLTRQVTTLSETVSKREDVPADVKASLGRLANGLKALEPMLSQPPRFFFGGVPRVNEILLVKLGQAKNGLMGGMPPTAQILRAYADVKTQAPSAVSDINAVLAGAAPLSAALAKYNLTLTVPPTVKGREAAPPRKTMTSSQRD
jgi:photosystem II stability/assembly factor-like uncharacterized protein